MKMVSGGKPTRGIGQPVLRERGRKALLSQGCETKSEGTPGKINSELKRQWAKRRDPAPGDCVSQDQVSAGACPGVAHVEVRSQGPVSYKWGEAPGLKSGETHIDFWPFPGMAERRPER